MSSLSARLIAIFAIALAATKAAEAQCPTNWIGYGKSCYYFSDSQYNSYIAQDVCRSRGGSLTSITSLEENDFLTSTSISLKSGSSYLVGLTDEGSEGNWRQLDSSPYIAANLKWAANEPNNERGVENCAQLLVYFNYQLNDNDCNEAARFICKRPLDYVDKCNVEDGWHSVNSKCYKLFDEKQNWFSAQDTCKQNDGAIITINTIEELRFVSDQVSCKDQNNAVWLGFTDSGPGNTLAWIDNSSPDPSLLQWDKGDGQPKSRSKLGNNCAVVLPINNYQWVLDACDTLERKFICEKNQGQCPSTWQEGTGGMCYKAYTARLSWTDAVSSCQAMGSSLIVPNPTEWSDRTSLPGRLLTDLARLQTWIGVSDLTTDNVFTTLSGVNPGSDVWAANNPDKTQVAKRPDCGFIDPADPTTKYQVGYCFTKRPYVCQLPISQILIQPRPQSDGYGCDNAQWAYYKNYCYYLEIKEDSYSNADSQCKSKGAYLVSIRDAYEQSFISGIMKDGIWAGADDLASQGNYRWTDQTPWAFTNWASTEPNNANKNEHCLQLMFYSGREGEWNDNVCTTKFDYICKKPGYPGGFTPPSIAPVTRPYSPLCGPGWVLESQSNTCYYLSDDQKTWADSRLACQKLSSELLSLGSKTETAFLIALFATDPNPPIMYWIGANRESASGSWQWSDKSPYRYINWNAGEPNGLSLLENCVEMYTNRGLWNDNKCSDLRKYICKKSATSTTTLKPVATTAASIISANCTSISLLSGSHWVLDSAFTASSAMNETLSGPDNSRLNWNVNAGSTIQVKTPDLYQYQPVVQLDLKGLTSITFSLIAKNDGHVTLQPSQDSIDRNTYEFVIGGWGNTRSALRSTQQGQEVTFSNGAVLDATTVKNFWISWAGGKIQMGQGSLVGQSVMFSYADPSPYGVAAVAVTTGWGATGDWSFDNPHGGRTGGWVPLLARESIYNNEEWIQADLLKPVLITAVITQGRSDQPEWVTEFSFQYKYGDASDWYDYGDSNGNTKLFIANTNQNSQVRNEIDPPVTARYVRLVPTKAKGRSSLRWELMGCVAPDFCAPERLVTGASSVKDTQLSASSLQNEIGNARLKALGVGLVPTGWVASPPSLVNSVPTEWIQIDFLMDMIIFGIITQGQSDKAQWVKSFNLQLKTNEAKEFQYYQEPYGTVKVFTANTDQNTQVTNKLMSPMAARMVKINVVQYSGGVAMRFDVLGCLPGCSVSPLVSGDRPIDSKRLTASSELTSYSDPSRARLDTARNGLYLGGWVPNIQVAGEYITVNFGVATTIRAVATQGRQDATAWVTSYTLSYVGNDGKLYSYNNGYKFSGNFDQNTIVKNFLPTDLLTSSLTFNVVTFNVQIGMRIEAYGCRGATAKYVGCYLDSFESSTFDNGPSTYLAYPTPQGCVDRCYGQGYLVAGMKRTTCQCSNRYPASAQVTMCDYKCPGDTKQFCGGTTTGYVSVYQTGLGPTNEVCADGYYEFNGKCFQWQSATLAWRDAQKACRSAGGDLATINSAAEQNYLLSHAKASPQSIWIGLNDINDEGFFEWSDGSPVLATFWNKDEPKAVAGKDMDCVFATSITGLWNHADCSQLLNSFCQQKKVPVGDLPTLPPPVAGCPVNWQAYGGSCYLFHLTESSWTFSNDLCAKESATLVRINDQFEQAFLTSSIYTLSATTTTSYWTDLRTYSDSRTTYSWSNKHTVIPYTQWAPGQPTTSLDADQCIALQPPTTEQPGMWVTKSCTKGSFAICEKVRGGYTVPPLPTLSPLDINCPRDWVPSGSYCFKVNYIDDVKKRLTWDESRADCSRLGATLGYFQNFTENDQIWRNKLIGLSGNFWIGLNDRDSNSGYIWDGDYPLSFTNWDSGEPNDYNGVNPCVEIKPISGKWNHNKCSVVNNWICSAPRSAATFFTPLVTTVAPTFGPPGSCSPDSDDWKFYNGNCYKVNPQETTWQAARASCMAVGGDLASIHDQAEQNFVQSLVVSIYTDPKNEWTTKGLLGGAWIGLNELGLNINGHSWSDNTGYEFTNWADSEPNDYGGGEYCVAMYARNGQWNDAHCASPYAYVCEKNKGAVKPVATVPPVIAGYCENGYIEWGNDCYKISTAVTDWATAQKICQNEGSFLTSVRNADEQTFLTSQLPLAQKAGTPALWIGLKHISLIGNSLKFVWDSNDEVTFTNWNYGEPNGFTREPCSEMLVTPAGKWNDVLCSLERGYICRKTKTGKTLNPPQTPVSNCLSGYTPYNGNCYKYVGSNGVYPWANGESQCVADGGHLTSITSPYEQSFIFTMLKQASVTKPVWIGLSSNPGTNTFMWTDNWPVLVTYWGKNEPSQIQGGGCIKYNPDGSWYHDVCSAMAGFVCKTSRDTPPYEIPINGSCPTVTTGENWVPFSSHCYFFSMTTSISTFDQAETQCRQRGAQLLTIQSAAETNFIAARLGLYTPGPGVASSSWIGLIRDVKGGYAWRDGSAVNYVNWGPGEPSDMEGKLGESCVETYLNGQWNDVVCTARRGYTCKIDQGVIPSAPVLLTAPLTTKATTPALCKVSGWVYFNRNCYLLVTDANSLMRWADANLNCQERGTNLVSILSAAENAWITVNLLPKVTNADDVWIGFAELQSDNFFRWTDGSSVSYVNWDVQQPDLTWGSMDCTAMEQNKMVPGSAGKWSTEYCYNPKAFICKTDTYTIPNDLHDVPITDGSLCVFPFNYRGVQYTSCTTYGTSYLWCSTTADFDRDGKWAVCDPYSCESLWSLYNKRCYYFSSDSMTWSEALGFCRDQGGDLAAIPDGSTMTYIVDELPADGYYWIGLNDIITEGSYTWPLEGANVPLRFANWAVGEPRNVEGGEDCVQTVAGKKFDDGRPGMWVTEDCGQKRQFICTKRAVPTLNVGTTTKVYPPTTQPTIPVAYTTPKGAVTPVKVITQASKVSTTQSRQIAQPEPVSSNDSLRTGETVAIVIACCALVLASFFGALYLRTRNGGAFFGTKRAALGFDNALYSSKDDTVQVQLDSSSRGSFVNGSASASQLSLGGDSQQQQSSA